MQSLSLSTFEHDRHLHRRMIVAVILSLFFNIFVWRSIVTFATLQSQRPPKTFIEISRVTIPRETVANITAPTEASPMPPPVSPPVTQPQPPLPQKKIVPAAKRKPITEDIPAPTPPPQAEDMTSSAPAEAPSLGNDYDIPAQALKQQKPEIPSSLRSQEFRSFVRVRVDIEENGDATPSLRTSSGNPDIDHIVLEALKNWRWKPATRNGFAVASTLYFKFVLEVK